ncbi:MAG: type II toxin-antitoxin system YafQ family toxin [Chloroflexi bacterium]|nr:type II toxin-antitoxin system YafQ family toxin [Chloroflexota bacterium]
MRTPSYTNQFEKDLRRMQRRGKKIDKLKVVLATLINEERLEERYRDHVLSGNYRDRRECHIEPDWLLIYKLLEDSVIFERTGSHSDLFE